MAVPSGYTILGLVGYADKGTYSASITYNKNNVVYYNGSTFVALKDGVRAVTPTNDGVNWKYMARGFGGTTTAANVTAVDTPGITSSTNKGKSIVLQTLLDKIASIAIKAVTSDTFQTQLKKYIVNNGTTTVEGFALDARQANPNVTGSLAKQISELNSQNTKSKIIVGNNIHGIKINNIVILYSTGWSTLSILPIGYRPRNTVYALVQTSVNGFGYIAIKPDGTMEVTANGHVVNDNVMFTSIFTIE